MIFVVCSFEVVLFPRQHWVAKKNTEKEGKYIVALIPLSYPPLLLFLLLFLLLLPLSSLLPLFSSPLFLSPLLFPPPFSLLPSSLLPPLLLYIIPSPLFTPCVPQSINVGKHLRDFHLHSYSSNHMTVAVMSRGVCGGGGGGGGANDPYTLTSCVLTFMC